jgi:hypothetical protein
MNEIGPCSIHTLDIEIFIGVNAESIHIIEMLHIWCECCKHSHLRNATYLILYE